MRFVRFNDRGQLGLAVATPDAKSTYKGWLASDSEFPGDLTPVQIRDGSLDALAEKLLRGRVVDMGSVIHLPPLAGASKIICVGLNYVDHSVESGFKPPAYPTIFSRFESSLIGHGASLVRPLASEQFDYEGEMVVVIGRGGRYIAKDDALSHVLAYSIFNDASVRDYQLVSPQWTIGKNFDGSGAFGPCLVTADELPPGGKTLGIRTRLNGQVVQEASVDDLIFDVASLISILSQTLTLQPGDIIVSGTPAGVGMARKPPLWMKAGDICEVEVDGIGVLRNPVHDEVR